jgi:signal transduction histidine kinase
VNSEKLNIIYGNRLFQNVPSEIISLTFSSECLLEVEEDAVIYKNGDGDNSIYLILEGQVKIKVYDSSSRSSLINKFVNEFFGEIEFLEKIPRKSTAMAVKKSLLYILDGKAIDALIKNQIINSNLSAENYSDEIRTSQHGYVKSEGNNFPGDYGSTLHSPNKDGLSKNDGLAWNRIDQTDFNEIFYEESNSQIDKEEFSAESLPTHDIKQAIDLVEKDDKTADNFSEQNAAKEYHELRRKIFETIYDETKTSLKLIVSYAEFLKLKTSSAEANKVLSKIIEQTDFISHTLETHSNFYLDRLKLKTQVLYAANILNEILLLLAGYTEFRGFKLLRKFEADASVVLDKNSFYQACLQVVKFLCENITGDGKIFVTLKRTKEDLLVEFKSSGEKVSEETLMNIFNPLPLRKNTTLELTKQIIAKHNGKIIVQNSTDAGPEIKFLLPVVK